MNTFFSKANLTTNYIGVHELVFGWLNISNLGGNITK